MKINLLTKETILIIGIIFIAFLVRVMFIASVEFPFFDERFHIAGAYNYIERGFLSETWYYPNLRSIILYFSMSLLGDNPLGWRVPLVLAGTLAVCFLYLLAFKLSASKRVALISSFLLAIDPLHISQSRVNPDETVTTFAFIAGIYFALRYKDELKPYLLCMAGIMLGIGVSVKWYAVFTIMIVLFISLASLTGNREGMVQKLNRLSFIFLGLIVLPATIYLATYYPWFGRGYSLTDFLWLQRDMYATLQSARESDFVTMSKLNLPTPLTWFILPTVAGIKILSPLYVVIVPFITNPFIWLLTLPSIAYTIFWWQKERAFSLLVISGAFFIQYLPLLLVKRPLFIHSALSVLPIAFIAIAFTLNHFFEALNRAWMLSAFLLLNLCLILILLPLLISYPIPLNVYDNYLKWVDMFLV